MCGYVCAEPSLDVEWSRVQPHARLSCHARTPTRALTGPKPTRVCPQWTGSRGSPCRTLLHLQSRRTSPQLPLGRRGPKWTDPTLCRAWAATPPPDPARCVVHGPKALRTCLRAQGTASLFPPGAGSPLPVPSPHLHTPPQYTLPPKQKTQKRTSSDLV